MASPKEVADLLFQIQGVASPLKRLKILARAWRTVRQLTPGERREIAERLGVEGAETLLEKLGLPKDGVAPALLLQAIQHAESADTRQLKDLLAGVRDPARREAMARTGLDFIEDTLAALPPEESEPPSEAPAAPRPEVAEEGPASAAPPEPPLAPALPPARPAKPQRTRVAPAAAKPPDPEKLPTEPPPAPRLSQAWDRLAVPQRRGGAPAQQPRPEAAPTVATMAAPPRGRPSVLTRLRELRLDRDAVQGASVPGLVAVAQGFRDGWARRRAIVAILEAGAPADLSDALGLIETLGSPRDRLWCLGALAATRTLGEDDRGRVEACAATPTAKRRLERLMIARAERDAPARR